MNTDAIESMVRDVLNRMNSLQDAAPVSAVPSASIQSAKVTDYPLANNIRNGLKQQPIKRSTISLWKMC